MAGKRTILALFIWAMVLLLIFMAAHEIFAADQSVRRPPLLTSVQFAYDWAVSLTFPLGPITNCEAAGVWDPVVQARRGTKQPDYGYG
ncbi:unnamed protein product [Miscanthus lutarioriparius]|uniref:Uncharacterized protein n=1 Tax=Miscanthus lutarioriparius TaxID=422564 RepID=A0A811RIY2_9POAL|nr:unnamed protein product [Miscanthus lutarioriparius]